MKKLNIDAKPHRLFFIVVVTFTLYTLLVLINFAVHYSIINPIRQHFTISLAKGIFFFINTLTFQNYATCYMLVVYEVYKRLTYINTFLLKIVEEEDENILRDLGIVANFLDKTSDCLGFIKFFYTINTACYLFNFAFFTILLIYGLISCIFQDNTTNLEISYCLLTLVWEVFYAPCVIWTLLVGCGIKREGKFFETNIHKLLLEIRQSKKVERKINLIILQLQHRRPMIENGFFVIEWKIVLSFAALCFSYLVIILQFELR